MTTTRWFWPGILTIPGVGLVIQEVWIFNGFDLGIRGLEEGRAAAAWGLWTALPFLVVAVQMGIAVRRNRLAWWLSLAAGVAVTLLGVLFVVAAHFEDLTDPLVGLTYIVTPLAQLGAAVSTGVIVVVLARKGRTTNTPVRT